MQSFSTETPKSAVDADPAKSKDVATTANNPTPTPSHLEVSCRRLIIVLPHMSICRPPDEAPCKTYLD
jgi:hypothetical protein